MFHRTKVCSAITLALGSLMAQAVQAQDAPTSDTVQRVEVTGSSIKRVDAETSVPVTIIKAEDLKKAGVTSVEQVLQQVSSMQVQESSTQAVGAGTGGSSYADMRGLGANKTLVLLNGRRLANSAFSSSAPDINTIPFAAIERVEVLRDGASALYGTDAISGVINFITKTDYTGGTVSVGMDKPQHAGGQQKEASFGYGYGDLDKDGFNLFGFVGFQKQNRISGTQRHLAPHTATSYTTSPASVYLTDNSTGDTDLYTPSDCNDTTLVSVSDHECGEDTNSFVDYIPETQRLSGYGKATFKLDANNTFNLEVFAAQSKVNSRIAPVPYATVYIRPTNVGYSTITDLMSSDDASLEDGYNTDGLVKAKFRDGVNGYREDDNTTTQNRVTASLEGALGDWDYNLGATLNHTHTQDYLAHGYANESAFTSYECVSGGTDESTCTMGYVLDDDVNPFGTQTSSTLKNAQVKGVLDWGSGNVQDIDGHASRDLADWLGAGRPAAIAVGFEVRREQFLQKANSDFATEVYASTGIDPATYNAGTRKVWAGYTELNVPLAKTLDVTAALRYDHYSDFGNTTNPKFSFRFQPNKKVLMRGSYSTGFRAPSLYELYAAQAYTNSTSGLNDPVYCPNGTPLDGKTKAEVCDEQFTLLTGGNTKLQPEKAKNATLGLVLEPIDNFTAEFDFYDIYVSNQISVLPDTTLFTTSGYERFGSNFHRNSSGLVSIDTQQCPGTSCGYVTDTNQNLGSVRTNGIDMALGYKYSAGTLGRFNFNLQSTWVRSYKYELVPGEGYTQNVGVFADSSPVFRWQHNATIDWANGPASAGLTIHHKSGYSDYTAGGDTEDYPARRVSAYTTFDLYGSYAFTHAITVTAGVKNLFDRMPPYTNYDGLFQQGYDPRYYDPTGRTFYARATYNF